MDRDSNFEVWWSRMRTQYNVNHHLAHLRLLPEQYKTQSINVMKEKQYKSQPKINAKSNGILTNLGFWITFAFSVEKPLLVFFPKVQPDGFLCSPAGCRRRYCNHCDTWGSKVSGEGGWRDWLREALLHSTILISVIWLHRCTSWNGDDQRVWHNNLWRGRDNHKYWNSWDRY